MDEFLESIKNWAKNEEKIESVIIVGSYAKGTYAGERDKMLTTQKEVDEWVEKLQKIYILKLEMIVE